MARASSGPLNASICRFEVGSSEGTAYESCVTQRELQAVELDRQAELRAAVAQARQPWVIGGFVVLVIVSAALLQVIIKKDIHKKAWLQLKNFITTSTRARNTFFIALGCLALLGLWFYWFEYRRYDATKECASPYSGDFWECMNKRGFSGR